MRIKKVSGTAVLQGNIVDSLNSNSSLNAPSIRAVNEGLGNIKGKILWTNPNPNVPFLPQEITLNESLVNYDCYEVIYLNTTSEDRYYNTGKIPKGHGAGIFDVYASLNTYGVGCRNREITYTSDTELTISEGRFSSGAGSQTVNNNACVPLYVIGYKTGLFDNTATQTASEEPFSDESIVSDEIISEEPTI